MEGLETQKQDYISAKSVCIELGISGATLKNWVKLGKITPKNKIKQILYFDKDYIGTLKNSIKSGELNALKSRRNKNFISGSGLYNSYLPDNSFNIGAVKNLILYIEEKKIKLSENDINEIISDCAKKLLQNRLCELGINKYKYLIQDICSKYKFIDSHPFIQNLEYQYNSGEDLLGLLYISLRNINSRKSAGAYYTPARVIEKINSTYKNVNLYKKKIVDPCCGTGNFLINFADNIDYKNLYGYDIDELSIKITRINVALKYCVSDKEYLYTHFIQKDFLNDKIDFKFDIIVGNPPWGYKYSKEERRVLSKKFECAKLNGFDSFDIFLECAIHLLNEGGHINFVLPESILVVKKHELIRKYIIENTILKYVYFLGNIFDNVQCDSIILGLVKEKGYFFKSKPYIARVGKSYIIGEANLFKRDITSENFLLYPDDYEYKVLKKISESSVSSKKTVLKNNATFALGIVTGDNKNYLSDEHKLGYEPILRGLNIIKYGWRFKNNIKYIKFEPKKFQQCAGEGFYRAPEKLLYKFVGGKLVFAYDNLQTLCLNSCNILIPQIPNLSVKYILAILNSNVAQFYFEKTFNSLKILKSHIEQIPIPLPSAKNQKEIEDMVNLILDSIKNNTDYSQINETLNEKIYELYRLSVDEIKIITNKK